LARGDLSNDQWKVIGVLLPPELGRKSRPAMDNRRFLNGMLHVLRIGCPWRDMHERYGKWNSVYVRFRRWAEQRVWDAILETLVDLGLRRKAVQTLRAAVQVCPSPAHLPGRLCLKLARSCMARRISMLIRTPLAPKPRHDWESSQALPRSRWLPEPSSGLCTSPKKDRPTLRLNPSEYVDHCSH
jgi:transposase